MKDLLTSRKFWAAIFALAVIVIGAFSPAFDLDTEQAAAFAVIIVAYVIGVAVDPGPGGWRGVIQSRKFWAAVVGLVLLGLDAFHLALPFELSAEQLIGIAVTIGGYIAGVALEGPRPDYFADVLVELDSKQD